MKVRFGAATLRGHGYSSNDDRVFVLPEYDVCAVSDSTGGLGRPSDVLLSGIRSFIVEHGKPTSLMALEAAVRAGEETLRNSARSDSRILDAGATLDIITFSTGQMFAVHVGDGRMYQIRAGEPRQLTRDHTWLEEQVAAGRLTRAEARQHPLQNVITRAFVSGEPVDLDTWTSPVESGDLIVLCSDGVWKSFPDEAFLAHAQADSAALLALLRSRLCSGGAPKLVDNASIIAVEVLSNS